MPDYESTLAPRIMTELQLSSWQLARQCPRPLFSVCLSYPASLPLLLVFLQLPNELPTFDHGLSICFWGDSKKMLGEVHEGNCHRGLGDMDTVLAVCCPA